MMTTMYDGHGIYYHTPEFSNYRVWTKKYLRESPKKNFGNIL